MNKQLLERDYPDDWPIVPLSDFAEDSSVSFVDGPFGSDLKVSDYTERGVRILQLQNLGDGIFKNKNKIYTNEEKARQLSRCITKPGDIAIAKIAEPLARAVIVTNYDEKYLIVADLIKLRPSRSVDTSFVVSFINFDDFRVEAERLSTGTTRTRISLSTLKAISLPRPPLQQQQKIAKILTTVDNLIEKTQALIDKYTAIKRGMMGDLFTRGIDLSGTPDTNPNHGQLRPPVEQAPELYKQTELGWVPKEWEVKPLSHYLSMITYGFTNPMPETEDGPWMVTAANVIGGVIDYKKTRKTSLKAFNILLTQKSKPKIGDILLTKDGTLGRLAIVDNEYLCINQSVALLRCNELAKPEFIKLLLETERYYQKMLDDAGGSAIKHIYITIVDKMFLGMPKGAVEQVAIFTKANAINVQMEFERKSLEKFSVVKKGLMQDLLTGKVRVK
jgi:type I restriction enzyme S subunit